MTTISCEQTIKRLAIACRRYFASATTIQYYRSTSISRITSPRERCTFCLIHRAHIFELSRVDMTTHSRRLCARQSSDIHCTWPHGHMSLICRQRQYMYDSMSHTHRAKLLPCNTITIPYEWAFAIMETCRSVPKMALCASV